MFMDGCRSVAIFGKAEVSGKSDRAIPHRIAPEGGKPAGASSAAAAQAAALQTQLFSMAVRSPQFGEEPEKSPPATRPEGVKFLVSSIDPSGPEPDRDQK
ncbi:hypothetical protein [Pelomonas sp. KK5]|uniref:hypothetical protein n=1 Tax=Pelomonas sp. KK5 TaxID=1855730 RepID=UPI001180A0AB|nr:hypothetical protein [Pelomonas sp. KK5]